MRRLLIATCLLACGPEMMDPPVYIPADVRGPPTVVVVRGGEAPPPVQPVPDQAMLGDWEGTGVQPGFAPWAFVLHLSSTRGRCAEVEYPSIPCSSYWTCEGVVDGQLIADEHLTSGQGRCVDDGRVSM